MKGLTIVHLLRAIEKRLNRPLHTVFDLVVSGVCFAYAFECVHPALLALLKEEYTQVERHPLYLE